MSCTSPWQHSVLSFCNGPLDKQNDSIKSSIRGKITAVTLDLEAQERKAASLKLQYEEAVRKANELAQEKEHLQLTLTMSESPAVNEAVAALRRAFDLFDASFAIPEGFECDCEDYTKEKPCECYKDYDDYGDFDAVNEALDKVLETFDDDSDSSSYLNATEAACAMTAITTLYFEKAPRIVSVNSQDVTQLYVEGKELIVSHWEELVMGKFRPVVAMNRGLWVDVVRALNEMDPTQKSLSGCLELMKGIGEEEENQSTAGLGTNHT
eukprot:PhF_6_TR15679/c0_g1_i2/m.24380